MTNRSANIFHPRIPPHQQQTHTCGGHAPLPPPRPGSSAEISNWISSVISRPVPRRENSATRLHRARQRDWPRRPASLPPAPASPDDVCHMTGMGIAAPMIGSVTRFTRARPCSRARASPQNKPLSRDDEEQCLCIETEIARVHGGASNVASDNAEKARHVCVVFIVITRSALIN